MRGLIATVLQVLVFLLPVFGQSSIDSLQQQIETATGTRRYDLQIQLARAFALSDYSKGLEAASQAHEYALHIGDSGKIVQSGRIMGQFYNYLGNTPESISILEKLLPIAQRHPNIEDLIKIHDNLGIAYTFQARYDEAMRFHLKALDYAEKSKEPGIKAFLHNNIGNVYLTMQNAEEALRHYLIAEKIRSEEKDYYGIDRLYLSIALAYNSQREFDRAGEYFRKALRSCNGACEDLVTITASQGYAVVELERGNPDSARMHIQNAIDLAKKGARSSSLAEAMFVLAKIELSENNIRRSREILFEVERIALGEKMRSVVLLCYRDLAAGYEREQDYANASIYLRKYIGLKDSIYNHDVMDNLAVVKSDFDQRENIAIIKAREATIVQQRNFNYAVIVIAVMAVGFGVFLFRNNRTISRMNRKLTDAQDLIFEQNRKLEVRNRELDQLVEKKTEELKLVNLSLRQMNDELDTFIKRTAEDIRAPLASLKGICNVALKDIRDEAPLVYLEKINTTTEVLSSILKRLLAINKINQSRISVSEIDLKTLVESVLATQQKKGLPRNLVIRRDIQSNAMITSDRELLTVVLENSIDNAIKFCNNSPLAEHFIDVIVKPTRSGRICFSIIDNGVGVADKFTIDEDELQDIFISRNDVAGVHSRKDLYFVKTAAKKIGGKVEIAKTMEGYNELSVII